jgi:hypothetical protein
MEGWDGHSETIGFETFRPPAVHVQRRLWRKELRKVVSLVSRCSS